MPEQQNSSLKIAIVNQRYGKEVNGGSEVYTGMIAGKLKDHFDVTVLTTCALDHVTWANHYPPGETYIDGVRVLRFPVAKKRSLKRFGAITAKTMRGPASMLKYQMEWIDQQGPYCPEFIRYIEEKSQAYDVFIFVTYLYYLTALGLPKVADKSILIPTAHDEPCIYLPYYRQVFTLPRAIIYLTEEERAFVQRTFDNRTVKNDVAAIGVTTPRDVDPQAFRRKYGIEEDFIIYVGRIEEGKGCQTLFRYFLEYKKRGGQPLKLVLMGKSAMDIPRHPDVAYLGFVSEEDKYNGIAAAKALVLPSSFESLSISVLEAMDLGVPVIVNGGCQVLKDHCVKSNGGLYYQNYFEFEGALNFFFKHAEAYAELRKNAREYVKENYTWDVVLPKLKGMIDDAWGGKPES